MFAFMQFSSLRHKYKSQLPFRLIACTGRIWICVKPRSDGPFKNDITSSGVYDVFSIIVSSIERIWSPTVSAPHLKREEKFVSSLEIFIIFDVFLSCFFFFLHFYSFIWQFPPFKFKFKKSKQNNFIKNVQFETYRSAMLAGNMLAMKMPAGQMSFFVSIVLACKLE